jgi:hypothetical protein
MIYLIPKGKIFGLALLITILSLAAFPQYGFSQIPTLDKLNLEAGQSPQCLDFNQDKICEYIVLLNGTMVKNPDATGSQSLSSFVAKNSDATGSQSTVSWTDPKTGVVYDIPAQGEYCLDFNGDYICDIDFLNGKMIVYNATNQSQATTIEDEAGGDGSGDDGSGSGSEGGKTYCDVPNPSNPCHDRKDYDQETGLYPCIDGSYEEDWRDCNGGGSGGSDDNDDNGNDSSDLDDDSDDDGNNCQGEDDFCDDDEGCESESVDCIDDRGFDEDDYNG